MCRACCRRDIHEPSSPLSSAPTHTSPPPLGNQFEGIMSSLRWATCPGPARDQATRHRHQNLLSDSPCPVPAWKWAAAECRGVLILGVPYPAVLSRFGPRTATRREPEVPARRTCQSPLAPRRDAREAGVG
ncbi:hypothetical protein B0T18DRAFT_106975 [Schizothecium vesticola]|uniref:Uncharacterized protein n=1 Tax=Schizothecium vesticola TaxID=314040 RepID=A0AA40F1S3_9PEZI|nr:hypothetical protein B0T18DRAFT_106975 [Schizothecium vesticola]